MRSKKTALRRSAREGPPERPLALNREVAARLQSEVRALGKAASVLGCIVQAADAPKEAIPSDVDLVDASQVVFEMLRRSIGRLDPVKLLDRNGKACPHCHRPWQG